MILQKTEDAQISFTDLANLLDVSTRTLIRTLTNEVQEFRNISKRIHH